MDPDPRRIGHLVIGSSPTMFDIKRVFNVFNIIICFCPWWLPFYQRCLIQFLFGTHPIRVRLGLVIERMWTQLPLWQDTTTRVKRTTINYRGDVTTWVCHRCKGLEIINHSLIMYFTILQHRLNKRDTRDRKAFIELLESNLCSFARQRKPLPAPRKSIGRNLNPIEKHRHPSTRG